MNEIIITVFIFVAILCVQVALMHRIIKDIEWRVDLISDQGAAILRELDKLRKGEPK